VLSIFEGVELFMIDTQHKDYALLDDIYRSQSRFMNAPIALSTPLSGSWLLPISSQSSQS
jgi:hypothetical protein